MKKSITFRDSISMHSLLIALAIEYKSSLESRSEIETGSSASHLPYRERVIEEIHFSRK